MMYREFFLKIEPYMVYIFMGIVVVLYNVLTYFAKNMLKKTDYNAYMSLGNSSIFESSMASSFRYVSFLLKRGYNNTKNKRIIFMFECCRLIFIFLSSALAIYFIILLYINFG